MQDSKVQLVFIHLGKSLPKYLILNLQRTKNLFPTLQIVLISDHDSNLNLVHNLDVKTWKYDYSADEDEILENLNHDFNFRSGFWKFSIQRLLALCAYRSTVEDSNVLIHIESDVLVLPNFPFQEFTTLNKSSWLRFNESHDVAAIISLKSKSDGAILGKLIVENLVKDKDLTDMTVLSKVSKEMPDMFTLLPSLDSGTSEMVSRLISPENTKDIQMMQMNYAHFGGIFDSAPIGMWLTGEDPRNHKGVLRRYVDLEESYIHPGNSNYKISDSGLQTQKDVIIYNLHIHSKNEKLFSRNWLKELTLYVNESTWRRENGRLLVKVFLQLSFLKFIKILKIRKKR
jgi:hypothetical protein